MTARAACGGLRLRHRERPRPHCNVTEIKRNLVKRTKWYKRKHSFATTNHICTALMYTHIYCMLYKTHRDSEIPNGGCIRDFVLPGMERGVGAVSTGHRGSLENSGSRISGSRGAAPEFGSFGGSTPPTRMFQKTNKERSFADTR